MEQVEFDRVAREEGFGISSPREYDANASSAMHRHDFAVLLLVVSGEFRLRTERGVDVFRPGDVCRLAAGVLHAEEAGENGAQVLLAKQPASGADGGAGG